MCIISNSSSHLPMTDGKSWSSGISTVKTYDTLAFISKNIVSNQKHVSTSNLKHFEHTNLLRVTLRKADHDVHFIKIKWLQNKKALMSTKLLYTVRSPLQISLVSPHIRLSTVGARTFIYVAPRLCNSHPFKGVSNPGGPSVSLRIVPTISKQICLDVSS